MGEKIKDLQEITVGSGKFMVELNEGYLKNEGRLIHIQNKHFRYLLKEKQFMKLASSVLRAREEMKYYKTTRIEKAVRELVELPVPTEDDYKKANELAAALTDKSVDYRLLEVRRGFATILINDDCYSKYRKAMKTLEIQKTVHPYSENLGYHFLYQMRPFELYVKDGFYYEFVFKLPCASLTPKSYIPVDRLIQTHVFAEDCSDQVKRIDDLSYCIYRICLAVFDREAFSTADEELFRTHKELLQSEKAGELLRTVFFGFTDELQRLLAENMLTEIIPAYYGFSDY